LLCGFSRSLRFAQVTGLRRPSNLRSLRSVSLGLLEISSGPPFLVYKINKVLNIPAKKSKISRLFILAILGINFTVYAPSLFHVSRADQDILLIETADLDNAKDLILYTYSFPRTRILNVGDKIFFRPLLYLFLSFEKSLFGYNFIYWQLTGILLHLLVVWQLYRILHFINPSYFAGLLALNFSVLYLSQEMVIWHHINAYLIFLIFLLEAFYQFTRYIDGEQKEHFRIWVMVFCLTLANFLYEFGLICNVVLIAAVYVHKKCVLKAKTLKEYGRVLALMAPTAIYVYWSLVDFLLRGSATLQSVPHDFNPWKLIYYLCKVMAVSAWAPFFPCLISIEPGYRVAAKSFEAKAMFSQYVLNDLFLNLNMLLILLLLAIIPVCIFMATRNKSSLPSAMAQEKKGSFCRNEVILGGTSLMFALGYALMIVVGRLNTRGLDYIQYSLYHFYIIVLFNTIFLYSILCRPGKGILNKNIYSTFLLTAVLLLSVFLNGYQSFKFNTDMKAKFGKWGSFIRKVERFVDVHKQEKDFSFKFYWREEAKLNPYIRIGDPLTGQLLNGPESDYLFRKYIDMDQPKYHLVYSNKYGVVSFTNKEEAKDYTHTVLDIY